LCGSKTITAEPESEPTLARASVEIKPAAIFTSEQFAVRKTAGFEII
jgi:hypothetical protein